MPAERKSSRPVLIEWIDSCGVIGEWEHREGLEPLEPVRCISVGFPVGQTDDYDTLAMTISDEFVLGRLTIPRAAIVKVRKL